MPLTAGAKYSGRGCLALGVGMYPLAKPACTGTVFVIWHTGTLCCASLRFPSRFCWCCLYLEPLTEGGASQPSKGGTPCTWPRASQTLTSSRCRTVDGSSRQNGTVLLAACSKTDNENTGRVCENTCGTGGWNGVWGVVQVRIAFVYSSLCAVGLWPNADLI